MIKVKDLVKSFSTEEVVTVALNGVNMEVYAGSITADSLDGVVTDGSGNDFVVFKASKTEPIAVQRKYHGVSTQITGYIKNVRVPFNVDIGVGDVIIPKAERRSIKTQLDGYGNPEILTYSLESTIAEKFDAILQRFELTGRMKDFYDIYYLSRTFDFDGLKLQTAISETLQNRGTAYEKDSFDRVLTLADNADMHIKWRHFLKKAPQNKTFRFYFETKINSAVPLKLQFKIATQESINPVALTQHTRKAPTQKIFRTFSSEGIGFEKTSYRLTATADSL